MQIISKSANNVGDTVVRFYPEKGEPIRLMIASDIHIDSAYCDKKLFKEHLDRAKEIGAYIVILGDVLDVMQWKGDKRSSKAELLPEYLNATGSYFNQILDKTIEFFEPYRDNLLLITYGNHETYHINKLEMDLLQIITQQLNCLLGGYEGYLTLLYTLPQRHTTLQKRIYYTHGVVGSSAIMTMGVLNHKRMDIWVRDADIILSGHNHRTFYYEEVSMGMNHRHQRVYKTITHLQLPTYKKYQTRTGYAVTRGLSPPPIGCYLLEFTPDRVRTKNEDTNTLKVNFSRWT